MKVEGRITGISPLSGSYLGGTLLTIDGVNFSEDPLDNPVKVGDYYCLVETTEANQITCRVMETVLETSQNAQVLVFLRTSEEAASDVASTFSYATPSATITGMSNEFDASLNAQIFSISGSGFPSGDNTAVSLHIDGLEQETVSVTATEATFKVTDAL